MGAGREGSGYVFARPDGAPIEGSTLTRHFNTLLHQARLRRIRFHGLRHSTAILHRRHRHRLRHVRLRLQRDAICLLGHSLRTPADTGKRSDDSKEPRLCATPVR